MSMRLRNVSPIGPHGSSGCIQCRGTKGTGHPGAGVKVVVSHLTWMLGNEQMISDLLEEQKYPKH